MRIKLTTFIDKFSWSKDSFVIIDDILYTIHHTGFKKDPLNYLQLSYKKFPIEESESCSELENEMFKENEKEIDTFVTALIQEEISSKEKEQQRIKKGLFNALGSISSDNIVEMVKYEYASLFISNIEEETSKAVNSESSHKKKVGAPGTEVFYVKKKQ